MPLILLYHIIGLFVRPLSSIFGESTQNNVLVNKLAAETNLPKPKLLYTEALSKESGPAKNYIELMKYNVTTIVESLK